ncbi:hypothetical protein ACU4GI_24610 [Cupriavidus basilensis]
MLCSLLIYTSSECAHARLCSSLVRATRPTTVAMALPFHDYEIVWLADVLNPDVWTGIDFWGRMKVLLSRARQRKWKRTGMPVLLAGDADGKAAELCRIPMAFAARHEAAYG